MPEIITRAIVPVPKLWPQSTVAILACGPSLNAEDCEFVRGKVPVIAINDAIRLAPWAEILYSSDRHWWPHYRAVPSYTGMRYGIGSTVGKANPFSGYPLIAVLKNTGWHGLELNPSGLRNGRNSGYAAINLAVHLGAVRILLLGYNMGLVHGAAHFAGAPPPLQKNYWEYASHRERFKTLIEPLAAIGVSVINCTEGSALDCFPHANLRVVLADREVAA